MATAADFLARLLSQAGDRYIFGHEVKLSDTNPSAFDCSELVEWAAYQVGVSPRVPDGSWYQARHCQKYGTLIPVSEAIKTPGALLFKFSSSPFSGGRPTSAHVAVSLGDGRTIEARSTKYGVGVFSASGRGWTHAGLVPGLTYEATTAPAPKPTPTPTPTPTTTEEAEMKQLVLEIQKSLNKAGARDHEGKALKEDGVWGPRTQSAFINGLKLGAASGTTDATARKQVADLAKKLAEIEGKLAKAKAAL